MFSGCFVLLCATFLFQCSIRRTAVRRCPSPAALITRPSSTVLSAHPMVWARLQHPALPLGQPQTRAQRGRSPARPRPLTPSPLTADRDSLWLLLFLAAMLTWGWKTSLTFLQSGEYSSSRLLNLPSNTFEQNAVKMQMDGTLQTMSKIVPNVWLFFVLFCSFSLVSMFIYYMYMIMSCVTLELWSNDWLCVFYIRVKCQSVSWLDVMGNWVSPALLQAYGETEQPPLFLYAFSILHMRRDRLFTFLCSVWLLIQTGLATSTPRFEYMHYFKSSMIERSLNTFFFFGSELLASSTSAMMWAECLK